MEHKLLDWGLPVVSIKKLSDQLDDLSGKSDCYVLNEHFLFLNYLSS
jgi:hypothetical protein